MGVWKMTVREDVDLVFLEADYRAGVKPSKVLAEEYGVSVSTINLYAKKFGWERDLKAVVRERAQAKVEQALATAHTDAERSQAVDQTKAVEIYAEIQKGVILRAQERIGNLQKTADKLIAELSAQMMDASEMAAVSELVALSQGQCDESESVSPAQVAKRVESFRKLLSLGDRVETAKKLSDVVKTLTALEYSVFGIKEGMGRDEGDKDTANVVQSINDAARRVAFVLASATRNKRPTVTLENEAQ